MNDQYVHYGCGLYAPKEWKNFDISPTLRIQKVPVLGTLLKGKLNANFPKNVKYGDVVKGLPVLENSCKGVYCSHTLEHLALEDFRKALQNTYKMLQKGGVFRCVVPDLEWIAKTYLNRLGKNEKDASMFFMEESYLGFTKRKRGIKGVMKAIFGNSNHLWMWDELSLTEELRKAGFQEIRRCQFNDAKDPMFHLVESEGRFNNALALEGVKPV